MKSITMVLGASAVALVCLPAHASEELAKKHACSACHSADRKLVGPAWNDIAAKYPDDKAAAPKLVEKVKKGGAGVWGQVPMPPNAHVPQADIQALVNWVLSKR